MNDLQLYEVLKVCYSKELQSLPNSIASKYSTTRVFSGIDGHPDLCGNTAKETVSSIASFLASNEKHLEFKTIVNRRLLSENSTRAKDPHTGSQPGVNSTFGQRLQSNIGEQEQPVTKLEAITQFGIHKAIITSSCLLGLFALGLGIAHHFHLERSEIVTSSVDPSFAAMFFNKQESHQPNKSNFIRHSAASSYLTDDRTPKLIAEFPNSNIIAIATQQQLKIARLDSFATIKSIAIDLSTSPTAIAISPDGFQIAIADAKGSILIWDKRHSHLKKLDNHFPISGLGFTHFSKKLISVDKSGAISFFSDGKEIAHLFGHESAINAIAIDRRDHIITADANGTIKIWNDRGKLIKSFKDSAGIVNLITKNTDRLYTSNELGIVRKWDLNKGLELNSFYWKDRSITSLDIANNFLITGSNSGEIKITHLESDRSQILPGTLPLNSVLSSDNNKYILGVSNDEIHVWQKISEEISHR
ncbi:MAG: WD40 repeat domain-containing protein [Prochloraceae cyanobacterium]